MQSNDKIIASLCSMCMTSHWAYEIPVRWKRQIDKAN